MIYGVDVIIIAPGAIATPIWDKADAIDVTRYANTPYAKALDNVKRYMVDMGRKGLPPKRSARPSTPPSPRPTPRPATSSRPNPSPTGWATTRRSASSTGRLPSAWD